MVDILAFGAHPDDIEFWCGGVLAKMASQGKSIVMVDLTLGQKGSHGSSEVRRKEAEEAAALIGAERLFLDFEDCEVYDTYEGRLELVKAIRRFKPRLVLAPYWKGEQNHPDHIACGIMARHACRYARFPKILPDLPPHRPAGILHYLPIGFDGPVDFLVDISDHAGIWKQMIECHHSQHKTLPYKELNLRTASALGVQIGAAYAQGFVKGNAIAIDDLMAIAQGTIEL